MGIGDSAMSDKELHDMYARKEAEAAEEEKKKNAIKPCYKTDDSRLLQKIDNGQLSYKYLFRFVIKNLIEMNRNNPDLGFKVLFSPRNTIGLYYRLNPDDDMLLYPIKLEFYSDKKTLNFADTCKTFKEKFKFSAKDINDILIAHFGTSGIKLFDEENTNLFNSSIEKKSTTSEEVYSIIVNEKKYTLFEVTNATPYLDNTKEGTKIEIINSNRIDYLPIYTKYVIDNVYVSHYSNTYGDKDLIHKYQEIMNKHPSIFVEDKDVNNLLTEEIAENKDLLAKKIKSKENVIVSDIDEKGSSDTTNKEKELYFYTTINEQEYKNCGEKSWKRPIIRNFSYFDKEILSITDCILKISDPESLFLDQLDLRDHKMVLNNAILVEDTETSFEFVTPAVYTVYNMKLISIKDDERYIKTQNGEFTTLKKFTPLAVTGSGKLSSFKLILVSIIIIVLLIIIFIVFFYDKFMYYDNT